LKVIRKVSNEASALYILVFEKFAIQNKKLNKKFQPSNFQDLNFSGRLLLLLPPADILVEETNFILLLFKSATK
jgi:hypothetical protein